MNIEKQIQNVQSALIENQFDGWLLYDFRRSNDLACEILDLPVSTMLSRRFFYWIPAVGEPVKIVHQIENPLAYLPGTTESYATWQELEQKVKDCLKAASRIAMEYSPRNAIPYVSKVDGGTLDMIKSFGVEIASSADLVQKYTCIWDEHQLESHLYAAELLDKIVGDAWDLISEHLRNGQPITEFEVQQFILGQFSINGCVTKDPPIVAVNEHSADPHYAPSEENRTYITPGDFVLIDLWCKQNLSHAVYADITRVGVAAGRPTERQQKIFSIVKQARDAGARRVKDSFSRNEQLCGWEVDEAVRKVISDAGYGSHFIHRTGHSIGEKVHGNGAHIDNYETQDQRRILPGTGFTIEPGIYLPNEFGVRLEYDIYVHPDSQVQITGGIQEEIVCLL